MNETTLHIVQGFRLLRRDFMSFDRFQELVNRFERGNVSVEFSHDEISGKHFAVCSNGLVLSASDNTNSVFVVFNRKSER